MVSPTRNLILLNGTYPRTASDLSTLHCSSDWARSLRSDSRSYVVTSRRPRRSVRRGLRPRRQRIEPSPTL